MIPVILSACRTPIGRFLGGLSSLSAVELGTIAAREAIQKAGVDPALFDETIVGNVLSAGLGQAPARQVALNAGLPPNSSALTVNMVCGSGLRAVMLASTAVRAGDAELILAGGMESMSNAPHLLRGARAGWKAGDGALVDSLLFDGLTCSTEKRSMGEAAEYTASRFGIARDELDAYALESYRRAAAAQKSGWFHSEIVPVTVSGKKGATVVAFDEGPRGESSLEALAGLKPAFRDNGVVTAGNSSSLSDGAAMLVVADEEKARLLKAKPLVRIVADAVAGVEPKEIFVAPIEAIRKVALKANLRLDEIDLFEINEAFASQMTACVRGLELDPAKVNVSGGAIALGHPIGASGARVLVTLIHSLIRLDKRLGLASLCLGGGNAVALIVERVG